MTALDTKLRPLVTTLVETYGRDVAVQAKPGSYVVASGATTAGASLGTIKAVVGEYESRYIDGTNIRLGDVQLIFAAEDLAFTPEQGQKYTVDGRQLKVVRVRPYSSGEQNAAWEVQVRA